MEREVAFYNSTLGMVRDARDRLVASGEPYKRPEDFFCEMIKSDTHMAKVKDSLIFQQKKMKAFEQRKERQHADRRSTHTLWIIFVIFWKLKSQKWVPVSDS